MKVIKVIISVLIIIIIPFGVTLTLAYYIPTTAKLGHIINGLLFIYLFINFAIYSIKFQNWFDSKLK